jgi:hypothetical protein
MGFNLNIRFISNMGLSLNMRLISNKGLILSLELIPLFCFRHDDESIRADTDESTLLLIPPRTPNGNVNVAQRRPSNGNVNVTQRRPSSSVVSNVGSSDNVENIGNVESIDNVVIGGGKSTKFENVGKAFVGEDSTDSFSTSRPRFYIYFFKYIFLFLEFNFSQSFGTLHPTYTFFS